MKLSIKDRINLLSILPKQGGIIDLIIVKSIRENIDFTMDEIKVNGIEEKDGVIRWKSEIQVDIPFTDPELRLLKDAVSMLDQAKGVTLENVDSCLKIRDSIKD